MKLFNVLKEICYRLNLITDYVVEQTTMASETHSWYVEIWKSGKAVMHTYAYCSGNKTGLNERTVDLPVYCNDFFVHITPAYDGHIVDRYGDFNIGAKRVHGSGYFYMTYNIPSTAYDVGFNVEVVGYGAYKKS